jgi:hypothetical protein
MKGCFMQHYRASQRRPQWQIWLIEGASLVSFSVALMLYLWL